LFDKSLRAISDKWICAWATVKQGIPYASQLARYFIVPDLNIGASGIFVDFRVAAASTIGAPVRALRLERDEAIAY
jgi:hypothetical protein